MTKKNGNIWKIVGILIGVGLAVAGWVWNAAVLSSDVKVNCRDIATMSPEVQKNSEHRIEDEIDTPWIKKDIQEINLRISRMEVMQERILEEVRK